MSFSIFDKGISKLCQKDSCDWNKCFYLLVVYCTLLCTGHLSVYPASKHMCCVCTAASNGISVSRPLSPDCFVASRCYVFMSACCILQSVIMTVKIASRCKLSLSVGVCLSWVEICHSEAGSFLMCVCVLFWYVHMKPCRVSYRRASTAVTCLSVCLSVCLSIVWCIVLFKLDPWVCW